MVLFIKGIMVNVEVLLKEMQELLYVFVYLCENFEDLKVVQVVNEVELICQVFEKIWYNKLKVVFLLNIDCKILYVKMQCYGIE